MRLKHYILLGFLSIASTLHAQELPPAAPSEDSSIPSAETTPDAQSLQSYAKVFGSRDSNIPQQAQKLVTQAASCDSKKNSADFFCLEKMNPGIKEFTDEYGMILQLGSSIASSGAIVDQCSGIAKALDKASKVLTLYQSVCGTAMGICNSACSALPKIVTAIEANAKNVIKQVSAMRAQACASLPNPQCGTLTSELAILEQNLPSLVSSSQQVTTDSAKQISYCSAYEKTRNSAMAGVTSALLGMKTSNNCKDEHSADPTKLQASVECTNTQNPNYNTKNCQCARNELTPAQCQGISVNPLAGNNSTGVKLGGDLKIGTSTDPNSTGLEGSGGGLEGQSTTGFPGAGMAGAPEGGGGGGLGGGSGGGSGYAQDGSVAPRRLNANVLGGFGGGGGGGGFGAGPGYGEVDKKLSQYGPGGSKDPTRSVASEIAKQVTAEGGRSNWEKIRSRYRDNQRTLLNK